MSDCVFCKIIAGEIPAQKIYEDDDVLAFLDVAPTQIGHTLVIGKNHFENIESAPSDELQKIVVGAKKVAGAIKKALHLEGYNLIVNNGKIAGQIVPHLHFHIIPRRPTDGVRPWGHKKYQEGEAEEIVVKVKEEMGNA